MFPLCVTGPPLQIGVNGQYFDLVNYDKLPDNHIFRVKKNMRFPEFRQLVRLYVYVPV